MRLIRLLVDVLSVNGVIRLRDMLNAAHGSMTVNTQDVERARVNNALQWMQGAQPVFSLQHLARRSFLRALSHRSLQDAATLRLQIPRHLLQYVLLLDD